MVLSTCKDTCKDTERNEESKFPNMKSWLNNYYIIPLAIRENDVHIALMICKEVLGAK